MPIDIETFEQKSSFEGAETQAEQVLRFLAQHRDKAFQRAEIAQATGIDPNSLSAVLSRLKDRDLVRHKPPYWALGDEERLRAAGDLHSSLLSLNETLGAEDMDEWRAAADSTAQAGEESNPE